MDEETMKKAYELMEIFYSSDDFNRHLKETAGEIVKRVGERRLECFPMEMAVVHFNEKNERMLSTVAFFGLSGENKEEMFRRAGREMALRTCGVLAVFLIFEAWLAKRKEEPQVPVSELPDREEAITLCGMTPDKRHNLAVIPIAGRDDGALKLGEPKFQLFERGDGHDVSAYILAPFWEAYMSALGEKIDKRLSEQETEKPGKKYSRF